MCSSSVSQKCASHSARNAGKTSEAKGPEASRDPGIWGLGMAAATGRLLSSGQCGRPMLFRTSQASQGMCQQLRVARATGLTGASSKPCRTSLFAACSPLPGYLFHMAPFPLPNSFFSSSFTSLALRCFQFLTPSILYLNLSLGATKQSLQPQMHQILGSSLKSTLQF